MGLFSTPLAGRLRIAVSGVGPSRVVVDFEHSRMVLPYTLQLLLRFFDVSWQFVIVPPGALNTQGMLCRLARASHVPPHSETCLRAPTPCSACLLPNLLGCSVARPSLPEHSSSTTLTLTMLNRNMSRITLILALACSASAFMVPAKVSKVPAKVLKLPATVRFSMMASSTKESSSTEESTKNMPEPAYPGIEMPFDTGSTSENSMGNVNLEVNKFLAEGLAEWVEILAKGTLKKDPEGFDGLQHIVTKNSNHAKKLPQGYKHFGGDDYAAQLCVILETNPFYASSLTPRAGGGFEIINYDPDGKTYSSRVMRTIGRPGPRVNVKFSVKPEGGLAIDGFDVYVSPAGDDKYFVVHPDEREEDNYYASAVLYDLLFVSETLHATVRTALTLDPKS